MSTPPIGMPSSTASAPSGLPSAGRQSLSSLHRIYFAFVAVFALWVGVWGGFFPERVAMALPWPVPPLHARVIGAMYLSGLVLMAGCFRRRWVHEVAVGLRMAVVWTGMLLFASLLHLGQFDPANPRVWFWFFAYVTFPIGGAWLAWRDRAAESVVAVTAVAAAIAPVPGWVRATLLVFGASFCVLAGLLFLAPQTMLARWPWKASVLLIQIYAGPCLSLGVGSLLLARPRHAVEIHSAALGMATFLGLVLLASGWHRALFNAASLSTAVWFWALVAATAALLAVLASRRHAAHGGGI